MISLHTVSSTVAHTGLRSSTQLPSSAAWNGRSVTNSAASKSVCHGTRKAFSSGPSCAVISGNPSIQHGNSSMPSSQATLLPSRPRHSGRRHRTASTALQAVSSNGVSLFPAGQKQATVVLPALLLMLEAAEVAPESIGDISNGADAQVQGSSSFLLELLGQAISAGATAVVLSDTDGRGGAGALYEAAVRIKEILRGRAALLLVDRTDIADVVGADGVLLTERGECVHVLVIVYCLRHRIGGVCCMFAS